MLFSTERQTSGKVTMRMIRNVCSRIKAQVNRSMLVYLLSNVALAFSCNCCFVFVFVFKWSLFAKVSFKKKLRSEYDSREIGPKKF